MEVEEIRCDSSYIFVAQKFNLWEDAMNTCMKLSSSGMDMSDFSTLNEFKHWHEVGNENKVGLQFFLINIVTHLIQLA